MDLDFDGVTLLQWRPNFNYPLVVRRKFLSSQVTFNQIYWLRLGRIRDKKA